ncbi:fatty acid biosynthesis [Trifolium repens]|nr:fatty acid biosynthesis [Trifolium repens]
MVLVEIENFDCAEFPTRIAGEIKSFSTDGSALGGFKVISDSIEALRISYRKMNPFCIPFATTNMGSAMLAMDLGWMGPNYSISTACATSNYCILNVANHIIRGEADVMLCGGSDSAIIPIGLGGLCRMQGTLTKEY